MGIFKRIRSVLKWLWKGYPKGPPPCPIIIHNLSITGRSLLTIQVPHFAFAPDQLQPRISAPVNAGDNLACTWANPNTMTVMFTVCWELEQAEGQRTMLTSSGNVAPQSAGSFILPVARGGLLLRVYMSAEQL